MTLLDLLVLSIASWRIGSMLANTEDGGPRGLLHAIRHRVGVFFDEDSEVTTDPGSVADGLMCIRCNTLWIALFFVIIYVLYPPLALYIAYPFSLSAAALFISMAYKKAGG